MGYYDFPHTRNYDTDLGYLIKRYFELSTDFESLEKNFNDLKAWCIAQLNSEALKTLVANKLDEWLQDGTLEALINNPLNHVTTYDTIVEMLPHSGLLEGSKIYCTGADAVNDGKGGHFRIRARLSTDNIDNYNLYLIDGGVKVAERIKDITLFYTVDKITNLTTLNDNLLTNVILVLNNDINVDTDTLSPKVIKVIGNGGIFNTTNNTSTILNVSDHVTFESNLQLFNKHLIIKSNSLINSQALPIWWGAVGDKHTDVNTEIDSMCSSTFKYLRFTKGVYVCYPINNIDGRIITFDNGAIIDGVIHIAYGSKFGSTTKKWCKDTTVIGKCVATIRVGGAMIDGLSMPDGIEILEKDDSYINQTKDLPRGVHWHFGCKNINVGFIKTGNIWPNIDGSRNYALGIDYEQNEEKPYNIFIENITCGANKQTNYSSILINGANNITINNIICDEGTSDIGNIHILDSNYININNYNGKCKAITPNAGCSHIQINQSNNCNLDNIYTEDAANTGTFGILLSSSNNCKVNNYVSKNQGQALRLLDSNNILVINFIDINNTRPIADANSTYKILNKFPVA